MDPGREQEIIFQIGTGASVDGEQRSVSFNAILAELYKNDNLAAAGSTTVNAGTELVSAAHQILDGEACRQIATLTRDFVGLQGTEQFPELGDTDGTTRQQRMKIKKWKASNVSDTILAMADCSTDYSLDEFETLLPSGGGDSSDSLCEPSSSKGKRKSSGSNAGKKKSASRGAEKKSQHEGDRIHVSVLEADSPPSHDGHQHGRRSSVITKFDMRLLQLPLAQFKQALGEMTPHAAKDTQHARRRLQNTRASEFMRRRQQEKIEELSMLAHQSRLHVQGILQTVSASAVKTLGLTPSSSSLKALLDDLEKKLMANASDSIVGAAKGARDAITEKPI